MINPRLSLSVLRLGFVLLFGLAPPATIAADSVHVLRGRIMDTSDNWLPDVRVRLRNAGVETLTDGNGLFELRLESSDAQRSKGSGSFETLQLEKLGYRTRLIEIKDATFFLRPIQEKMTPEPVRADTIGFTVLMPTAPSIHGLRTLLDPTSKVTGESLRGALERVGARPKTESAEARFYAYVPKNASRVRVTFLISLHGMGSVDHPVLRRFADEDAIALIGVEGQPVQRGCFPVALLDPHLEKLGEMTKHPELAKVPVLTFGHSNGTGFATGYAASRPERLIGWVSYHSGFDWQLLLPGVERAPGLVMHGQLDQWLQNGQEQAVQTLRRERRAPVAMMLEGNVGHGPVDPPATWEFIVAFCRAAMRARLAGDGTLRPVALPNGWLGGRYDRKVGGQQELAIAAYDEFKGDRADANWLPDRTFAEIWQRYGMTNPRRTTAKPRRGLVRGRLREKHSPG